MTKEEYSGLNIFSSKNSTAKVSHTFDAEEKERQAYKMRQCIIMQLIKPGSGIGSPNYSDCSGMQ